MRLLATVLAVVVAATLVGSLAIVRRLHDPDRGWGDVLRSRLVLGVPWGSLVVSVFVVCVYLFVQDGITDFGDPVTIPYRSWSYFYPLGMLTSSFTHADPGHLIGNLSGTVVVAPIVEYAWGHYPDGRDSHSSESESGSWRTDPWVRALVIFPLAVVGVGLVSSLFELGPVIGFSGVVFAFAGFALVHYPITTVVGILGVQSALLRIYYALRNPINVYVAEPRPPSPPSWAGIAIQGHALGLFVGFVLGIALLRRRGRRPDPLRLWLAILLFGFSKSLWAIYWFGGENRYLLFQGPGVAVVTALALVVTLSMTASERPLVPPWLDRRLARVRNAVGLGGSDGTGAPAESNPTSASGATIDRLLELGTGARRVRDAGRHATAARLERIRELAGGSGSETGRGSTVTRRQSAFVAVILVLAVLAGIAIPVNLLVVDDSTATTDAAVEIEDYTIEYVEGARNGLVSGIGIEALEDDEGLRESGVIVASERRNVWINAVRAQRLAATGEETVTVGGPGWRETVHVERTGWEPVGNETVYQVWVWEDGAERRLAHESNASQADVRIDNRTVTLGSEGGTFVLEVESNETGVDSRTTVPTRTEPTEAGGLTFERENESIYASADGTEVAIASEERYQ